MHDRFVDVDNLDDSTEQPKPYVPESTFLELYALGQSLPGPGSTQLATSLGATFGGLLGGVVTFFLFALPGMTVMTLAGKWYHSHLNNKTSAGLISRLAEYFVGLIAAALATVVLAAIKIISKGCKDDKVKYAICVLTATVAVVIPPSFASGVFILLLIAGGVATTVDRYIKLRNEADASTDPSADDHDHEEWECGISPRAGLFLIAAFAIATVFIFVSRPTSLNDRILKIFWVMGAMVFGGGVVVIPLILKYVQFTYCR